MKWVSVVCICVVAGVQTLSAATLRVTDIQDVSEWMPDAGQPLFVPIEFTAGDDALVPTSKLVLTEMARILSAKSWDTLLIVGNTDSSDNGGSVEKNRQLSLRRADAVKRFLVSKGIPAQKIQTRGDGGSNPIATHRTSEGRATNRRIDFVLTKP
jgi:outer membrane protein OmpA-like peptidoglycan-associated protein